MAECGFKPRKSGSRIGILHDHPQSFFWFNTVKEKKKNPLPSGKNNITGDYSMPGIGGLGLSRLWSRALPLEISKLTLQNSGTLGNKE